MPYLIRIKTPRPKGPQPWKYAYLAPETGLQALGGRLPTVATPKRAVRYSGRQAAESAFQMAVEIRHINGTGPCVVECYPARGGQWLREVVLPKERQRR